MKKGLLILTLIGGGVLLLYLIDRHTHRYVGPEEFTPEELEEIDERASSDPANDIDFEQFLTLRRESRT